MKMKITVKCTNFEVCANVFTVSKLDDGEILKDVKGFCESCENNIQEWGDSSGLIFIDGIECCVCLSEDKRGVKLPNCNHSVCIECYKEMWKSIFNPDSYELIDKIEYRDDLAEINNELVEIINELAESADNSTESTDNQAGSADNSVESTNNSIETDDNLAENSESVMGMTITNGAITWPNDVPVHLIPVMYLVMRFKGIDIHENQYESINKFYKEALADRKKHESKSLRKCPLCRQ